MAKASNLFFQDFAWAVPLAFADPISDCHFELGDTLYENAAAYTEPWSKNRKTFGQAIQVLAPARGVAGKALSQDDSALNDSWHQEVKLDLHDLKKQTSKTIITTQGRLYTLLWKGDQKVLDITTKSPKIPSPASGLKKHFSDAASFFQKELLPDPATVYFCTLTDAAAGTYREKYFKMKIKLEQEFSTTSQLKQANELGLGVEFFPTVQVAYFEMKNTSKEAVEIALQDVLYKPSAQRKTTGTRFRLQAHGLLI